MIAADTGGGQSSALGYITIPKTALDIDEVERHLGTYAAARSDAGLWVSSQLGARDAIMFTRLAEKAFRTHPLEDKPRLSDSIRCMRCSQWSLEVIPPLNYLDDQTVSCRNRSCGLELDQTDYERALTFQEMSK